MNGRVYDYNLGRFMSVDPFIHGGSQGINPYSYLLNNPMAGTDPSGYSPEDLTDLKMSEVESIQVTENGDMVVNTDNGSYSIESVGGKNVSGGYKGLHGLGLEMMDAGSQSSTAASNNFSILGQQSSQQAAELREEFFMNAEIEAAQQDAYAGIGLTSEIRLSKMMDQMQMDTAMGKMSHSEYYDYMQSMGEWGLSALPIPAGSMRLVPWLSKLKVTKETPKLLTHVPKNILFKGDEAIQHFGKHGDKLMKAFGRSSYNLKNYVDDANHVIQKGTFVPEMNGYVRLIGGKGSAKYGFVGLDRATGNITTFHAKSVSELARKAPSLGLSK